MRNVPNVPAAMFATQLVSLCDGESRRVRGEIELEDLRRAGGWRRATLLRAKYGPRLVGGKLGLLDQLRCLMLRVSLLGKVRPSVACRSLCRLSSYFCNTSKETGWFSDKAVADDPQAQACQAR